MTIKRIFLLKPKEGVTQAQIDDATAKTLELYKRMKVVKHVEHGTNMAGMGSSMGYTLGFIIHFETEEQQKAFETDPEQQQLNKAAWAPLRADVLIYAIKN